MEVFHYQRLVDLYNNLPYHAGTVEGTIRFPPMIVPAEVYKDLILQLDSAVLIIKGAILHPSKIPGPSDVMFQGDMDKWIRFDHTLKLKILMRQTELAGGPAYITKT